MTENNLKAEGTSCDPALTRKEFIQKVLKGAALTGGIIAAPKVLDKFILPALASGLSHCTPAGTSSSQRDTFTNGRADIHSLVGNDTQCVNGLPNS